MRPAMREGACTSCVCVCVCVQEAVPTDLYPSTLQNALVTSAAMGTILAAGLASPSAAFSGMLTKFGLASICGEWLTLSVCVRMCEYQFRF